MNTPDPKRALVVDDDASWLAILTELLSDLGLLVDQASNYDDALIALKTTSHRVAVIDLALSARDHHNRDGLRILEAARLHDPGCHTILLTGYATVELAVSVLTDFGAYTCLRKETFQRADFRKLIKDVLAASPTATVSSHETPRFPAQDIITIAGKSPPNKQIGAAIIVEDDAGWREILAELLSEFGYSVRQCSGFGEAIGYLGRERYDVAVIDLSLKDQVKINSVSPKAAQSGGKNDTQLDGYRLLETARASGLPTIVVSGVASPAIIEFTYQEYDVFSCIEKQSFDRRAFTQVLTELHSASRSFGQLEQLTNRERQVLELLVKGMTNKDIANMLVITPNTVKRHLKAVFDKLEVHTRAAAVAKAIKLGL